MKFIVSCKYCDEVIEMVEDKSYAENRGFNQNKHLICDKCRNLLGQLNHGEKTPL